MQILVQDKAASKDMFLTKISKFALFNVPNITMLSLILFF